MKYGFTLPGRGPLATPENLGIIARHGEELGFFCLMASDHIVVPRDISSTYPYTEGGEFPGSVTGESMEQLTVLAFLAGQTKTIKLGTSVMIVPHRNPVVTAKALATLDVLSQGRVIVGVGVGWMQEEFEALGLPPFKERGPSLMNISGLSRNFGPVTTRLSMVNIASFPTYPSYPSRCRSPIRPSGSVVKAGLPSDALPSWGTAGTPSAPTRNFPWGSRNNLPLG